MSRSRRPQCSTGRGCYCCGDAGANRRKRERAWAKADGHPIAQAEQAKGTGHPFHHDAYYEGKHHEPWLRPRSRR